MPPHILNQIQKHKSFVYHIHDLHNLLQIECVLIFIIIGNKILSSLHKLSLNLSLQMNEFHAFQLNEPAPTHLEIGSFLRVKLSNVHKMDKITFLE